MADTLDFKLRLKRGALFQLDVEESIPLTGITAVVGPSGGGKTTFLRALAGLEAADEADVVFRDEPWDARGTHMPPEARRIGFVFQSPTLFPHLNVAGNLAYGARRREVKSYEAIVDALDLGPLLSRHVDALSGGEARRVALGRALASNPSILFLDEPLSGLDQARKAELLPYIGRAVGEARVPALYISHDQSEVVTLADRVIGLSGGRLTGWRTPPARLTATVTSVTDGVMRVLIDGALPGQGADLTLPLVAETGESVGLGLPGDSILISTDHPGRTDAVAVLPATVIEGAGSLNLEVFGQRIALAKGGPHVVGAKLWLSILRTLTRPSLGDSAENRR